MINKVAVIRLFAAAIVLLVYVTIPSQAAHSKPPEKAPPSLFTVGKSITFKASSTDSPIQRVREAELNLSLLGSQDGQGIQSGTKLGLNLFVDANFTAVPTLVTSKTPGRLMWQGYIEGAPLSEVTLVVHEDIMAGSIRHDGHLYKIGSNGFEQHIIQEVQRDEPLPELPPISVNQLEPRRQQQANIQSTDDGSVIDIMILYTPAARQAQGGRRAMEALIDLAIEETNRAYSNSQINSRLRLVHTAEVSYVESGSLNLDLGRLRIAGDGYMDEAIGARDNYSADLVNLVVERGNGCGVAYVMTRESVEFEAYAFSIVQRQCAAGYYSLGHELGHNMGSAHNRDSQPPPGYGVSPYSYGYRDEEQAFRTIMAYDCPEGCARVPYFSNPQVYYNGQTTGVSYATDPVYSADNANSIDGVLSTVANWRPSRESLKPPGAPTNLGVSDVTPFAVSLQWDNLSDGARGIVIER